MDSSLALALSASVASLRVAPTRRDPYHTKRRKHARGRAPDYSVAPPIHRVTSQRAAWKQVMRLRAEANYNRLMTVEKMLALNGWRYRDFVVALHRNDKVQLAVMVAWLKSKLPEFEAQVHGTSG